MKFTASRLSEGNKIFPAEIHLESTGVTIKIPGLFSGELKHFDYNHIASVEIDSPLIGYSTISIFAGGTEMSANGFTKAEANEIKAGIEQGKIDFNKATSNTFAAGFKSGVPTKSVADELIKLKSLLQEGVLTAEEFETQKTKLLHN